MKNWSDLKSEVESEIISRHQLAKNNAQLNLDKILETNIDIKNIYEERKSLVSKIAREEMSGNSADSLKQRYKELGNKIKKKLEQKKISKEEILPNYFCKVCEDTGRINNDLCKCYKKELEILQYKNNNLDVMNLPSFETTKFDKIKEEKQRKQNKALYESIQKLLRAEKLSKNTITIFGNVGTGKTHLMECIAHDAIKKGLHTIYLSFFNFNKKMLGVHCQNTLEKEGALAPYLECDILLLDDMGSENIFKNVTLEYLYLILDERMCKNKLTILTTNLTFEQIREVYDERIFSRIASTQQSQKFQLSGEDLRLNI